jgi:hypothetical protein
MAVLYVQHYQQFFDDSGDPLAYGKLYTYAAGTTTPKATYTTSAGDVSHPNPIILDASGRPDVGGCIFLDGSYKFVLHDSTDTPVADGTRDNITSFTAYTETNQGFFQSFSGDAVEDTFTLTDNLGNDEKSLMVFSELEYSTNGTFVGDTGWTKGSGWTIAAGVATATGAISTALEQSAGITIIQGKTYLVKYTVTRSAGSITPSLGGTAGTARSASGTYSEEIIAGSTQTISFGTSGFTGTLDNVSVRDVGGLTIRNPGDYTLDGDELIFIKPPASGTGNIFVFAPYTLIGAAGAAQTAADAAIAAQAGAEAAVNAVAYQFTFDSSTSMADPGTGDFRLNNATLASVTAIAVDALSSVTGNPDVSDGIAAWGGSGSTNKGQLKITKSGTPATFALYNITAAVTDNTGWLQITVSHVASNGTFTAADVCYLQNARTGDVGSQGPTGTVSGASSGTMVGDDKILFLDTSGADALTYDDPATIDVAIFGSGSATDGYVLTADGAGGAAFEAIASTASGWVPIKTVTASAVATVDFVNGSGGVVIDSTYRAYALVLTSLRPASDGADLWMRVSDDGGSTWESGAGEYDYGGTQRLTSGTTVTGFNSTGAAQIVLAFAAKNNADNGASGIIVGYDTQGAGNRVFKYDTAHVNSGNAGENINGMAFANTGGPLNGFRIMFSTGNITSGTITLYGLASAA